HPSQKRMACPPAGATRGRTAVRKSWLTKLARTSSSGVVDLGVRLVSKTRGIACGVRFLTSLLTERLVRLPVEVACPSNRPDGFDSHTSCWLVIGQVAE